MTSITTFTSAIASGIARQNRFKVILPGDSGNIGIMCYACNLPQRTMKTFDLNQRGVPYSVPFSQQYTPITFSFYATTDYNTRKYFDSWQHEVVISFSMNVMGTYSRFAKEVKIQTLNRMGVPSYKIKLIDAYPITIGDADLNYGTNNTYQTVSVTLSYKYWVED